ncbi:alpha/beta hydrolase [Flagellimonas allohymeniacidonis]|uniref:Alpha/beta hydrolase n=1 Tax=Flagellimonas allohymeniacidonis TaxID=2517819 RepID=A0A4Q8QEW0_9FLAO|nr:alpha/beta hydrolase-fold protein [Allomuricauda hymeniacidonis]TAI49005.1 alpha/beta hydrolase [Allomuricauda hymeniacidonis]
MKRLVAVLLPAILLSSHLICFAQNSGKSNQEIVIGERFSLFSKALNEDREVFISLPSNYNRNQHKYPVIFVLDAEYLFEITNGIVKIKVSRNEMPESIVVGIPNSPGKRYDMAMPLSYPDGRTFFGDADGKKIKDYLKFVGEELNNYLENNYKVNPHRTIIGMSPTFGPVLEAFWNQPDLFDGYIVLAAELAVKTTSGKTIQERVLHAIQEPERSKCAVYIGKASDDLKRRPKEEALAYVELNQRLERTANPKINYRIEILKNENHYGMATLGIKHGLENIYPFSTWTIPYRDFWEARNPAKEIRQFYDKLSAQYGFEILPLEDSFYAAQTLSGTARRLKRQGKNKEAQEVLQLALKYYPNSPYLKRMYSDTTSSE